MKNGAVIGLGIATAVFGLASIVVNAVKGDANGYSRRATYKKAEERHLTELDDITDQYEAVSKSIESLHDREKKEIADRMTDWDTANSFGATISALNAERDARIKDIKDNEFHYTDTVQEIKRRAEDNVEDWKIREDYAGKLADIDSKVEEVKSTYSKQKTILGFTNSNNMNDELMRVASEEKKRKLDELNTRKQRLNSDLKAFKNSCDSVATREIRSLDERVNRRIDEVKKDIESRASVLRHARTEESAKITSEVIGSRTEEESNYEKTLAEIEKMHDDLSDTIENEYQTLRNSQTETQKVAALLRDKYEWSSATVIGVGAIPAVLGAVGIAVYMDRVFEIAGAMKEEC